MKFLGDGLRAGVLRAAGVAFVAAVLASCGGGQQIERFVPTRVLAFGDESSVINASGSKYTVNGVVDATATPPGVMDCSVNPIWVQYLATAYGLVFPQCPGIVASPPSRILAQPDTKAADVAAQITSFTSGDTFNGKDLVTVLAGQNDILEQYQLVKGGLPEAQASAVLEAAGTALADQVNIIARAGGKVLISTVPDLSLTPFAVTEGPTNAAVLSRLTFSFNRKLRLGIINDGHMIGLLLTDEMVQSIVKTVQAGATTTYVDVTHVACDPAVAPLVQDCTTLTLKDYTGVPDTVGIKATATGWLWADATHLSAGGHASLGSSAYSRAAGNPF